MDAVDDRIGLRIPSCYRFPFSSIVVLTCLGKFSHKFGTAIKHNSMWKWVTSKSSFSVISAISVDVLLGICVIWNQLVAGLIIVRHHNLSVFYFQRYRVWANEVYTYRVPGICFSLFR